MQREPAEPASIFKLPHSRNPPSFTSTILSFISFLLSKLIMDPCDQPDPVIESSPSSREQSLKDKLIQRRTEPSAELNPPGAPPSRDLIDRLGSNGDRIGDRGRYDERDRDRASDDRRNGDGEVNSRRSSRWNESARGDREEGEDGGYNRDNRGYPDHRNGNGNMNGYGGGRSDSYMPDYTRGPPPHLRQYDQVQYDQRPPPPTRDGQNQSYHQYNRGESNVNGGEGDGVPPPGAWGRRSRPENGDSSNPNERRVPLANVSSDSSFFASRDAQRKSSTYNVWPKSPVRSWEESEEEKEREEKKNKKSKKSKGKNKSSSRKESKSKRKRYDSESESDSDSEDSYDRRKSRKSKNSKSSRKEKYDTEDEKSRSKSKSKSRKRYDFESSDSESEDERRREKKSSRSKHSRSKGKGKDECNSSRRSSTPSKSLAKVPSDVKTTPPPEKEVQSDSSSSSEIGPSLPKASVIAQSKSHNPYGGALLAGEGEAMAQFTSEGQRIPRRGEIGVDSAEIEKFESVGFVMSGSRHRRMNAVRIRKENQVISAEEKRGILKLQAEEREKREREIVGQVSLWWLIAMMESLAFPGLLRWYWKRFGWRRSDAK